MWRRGCEEDGVEMFVTMDVARRRGGSGGGLTVSTHRLLEDLVDCGRTMQAVNC